MTKFNEYIYHLDPAREDEVCFLMQIRGVQSFFIYEKPGEDKLFKLYLVDPAREEELTAGLEDMGLKLLEKNIVEEKDWIQEWLKTLEPFEFIPGIWINPFPDRKAKVPVGSRVFRIVPGTAFGTGLHHTTRLAARLLRDELKEGMSVLDVGCGTGILSLLALELGADRLLASDNDPMAVIRTREVFEMNGRNIDVIKSSLLEDIPPEEPYDIIVANIVAPVLEGMIRDPRLKELLVEDGRIILSGISKERRDEFFDVLTENDFEVVMEIEEGEWIGVVVREQGAGSREQ